MRGPGHAYDCDLDWDCSCGATAAAMAADEREKCHQCGAPGDIRDPEVYCARCWLVENDPGVRFSVAMRAECS